LSPNTFSFFPFTSLPFSLKTLKKNL